MQVIELKPNQLTPKELIALIRVGYRPPLSARIGNAPLHVVGVQS